jgi:hypothetical protein
MKIKAFSCGLKSGQVKSSEEQHVGWPVSTVTDLSQVIALLASYVR